MPHPPTLLEAYAASQPRTSPMLARLRGYRTVLFNALTGSASVGLLVLGYLQTVDLSAVLSPQEALLAAVAINVANIVLRAVTTTPLGQSGADEAR